MPISHDPWCVYIIQRGKCHGVYIYIYIIVLSYVESMDVDKITCTIYSNYSFVSKDKYVKFLFTSYCQKLNAYYISNFNKIKYIKKSMCSYVASKIESKTTMNKRLSSFLVHSINVIDCIYHFFFHIKKLFWPTIFIECVRNK